MPAIPSRSTDGGPGSTHPERWYGFWRRDPWKFYLWNVERPRSAVDLNDPLGGALEDATVLIAFAAQSRKKFNRERLIALTGTTQALIEQRARHEPVTSEQQAAFWDAYNDLASDTAPANVQSIRATTAFYQTRFFFFSPVLVHGIIALLAFGACVALQGFWSAGRDLLAKVDADDALGTSIRTRIQDNEAIRRRSEVRFVQLTRRLCDPGDCGPKELNRPEERPSTSVAPEKLTPAERTRLYAELRLAQDDLIDKNATGAELARQLDRVVDSSNEIRHSVQMWRERSSAGCRWTFFVCPFEPIDTDARVRTSGLASPGRPLDRWLASNGSTIDPFDTGPAKPKAADDAEQSAFRDTIQQIRIIIRAIGDYWIPMFMGLLGAMTFILRSLTIQLREYTYVSSSAGISAIRICLGAVAGVFGALLSPATEGALKSLPPLFIPFVFGYGIEILFSLMDNVVTSFTQGEGGAARPKVLG